MDLIKKKKTLMLLQFHFFFSKMHFVWNSDLKILTLFLEISINKVGFPREKVVIPRKTLILLNFKTFFSKFGLSGIRLSFIGFQTLFLGISIKSEFQEKKVVIPRKTLTLLNNNNNN